MADETGAASAESPVAADHGGPTDSSSGGAGPAEGKFLYFAYGSNLLARRLLIMNPTAQRFGIGELRDYRLDFSTPSSKRWGGAPATVVPDPGESVWGAVWSLDIQDREHLDQQEGVATGWYDVFNATVTTPAGIPLPCRCYSMHEVPARIPEGERRPLERRPSLIYKRVILTGARESGLPDTYIARLEAFEDNGSEGVDPPITLESLAATEAPASTSSTKLDQAVAPAAR